MSWCADAFCTRLDSFLLSKSGKILKEKWFSSFRISIVVSIQFTKYLRWCSLSKTHPRSEIDNPRTRLEQSVLSGRISTILSCLCGNILSRERSPGYKLNWLIKSFIPSLFTVVIAFGSMSGLITTDSPLSGPKNWVFRIVAGFVATDEPTGFNMLKEQQ